MHKKSTLLILLFLFFLHQASCSQSKKIINVWAFAREILYGKELKGLDGNTVSRKDTAYFFYLEVKGHSQPLVTAVSYKGKKLFPSVYPVAERQLTAGIEQVTGKKIIIKRRTANTLWRVELNPPEGPANGIPASDKMIINGTVNKQPFLFTIKTLVLLEADIVG